MRSVRFLTFSLLPFLFFIISCSTPIQSKSRSVPSEPDRNEKDAFHQEVINSYYDFDDILVPKGMKLVPKSCLLFETPQLKAGLLQFEGRVEPVSLFNFFINNMPKDSWQLSSYVKYGRYIIVFEKPDKNCVISINEVTLKTLLQIWVTPRLAQ